MDRVSDILLAYENEVLVPLVEEAGVDPIRDDIDFVMVPGTTAFLMNNAQAFDYVDNLVYWIPLSVLYTDPEGSSGTVYSIQATLDPQTEIVTFQQATMNGIVDLIRRESNVVWKDPISGKTLITYPLEESDKILMNSWYLFRAGILPMLRNESYRFVPDEEKFAFQQTMIRHINQLYQGLV